MFSRANGVKRQLKILLLARPCWKDSNFATKRGVDPLAGVMPCAGESCEPAQGTLLARGELEQMLKEGGGEAGGDAAQGSALHSVPVPCSAQLPAVTHSHLWFVPKTTPKLQHLHITPPQMSSLSLSREANLRKALSAGRLANAIRDAVDVAITMCEDGVDPGQCAVAWEVVEELSASANKKREDSDLDQ